MPLLAGDQWRVDRLDHPERLSGPVSLPHESLTYDHTQKPSLSPLKDMARCTLSESAFVSPLGPLANLPVCEVAGVTKNKSIIAKRKALTASFPGDSKVSRADTKQTQRYAADAFKHVVTSKEFPVET